MTRVAGFNYSCPLFLAMDDEYHINIQYQQKLMRTSLVYAWFQTLHHARVPRLIYAVMEKVKGGAMGELEQIKHYVV